MPPRPATRSTSFVAELICNVEIASTIALSEAFVDFGNGSLLAVSLVLVLPFGSTERASDWLLNGSPFLEASLVDVVATSSFAPSDLVAFFKVIYRVLIHPSVVVDGETIGEAPT